MLAKLFPSLSPSINEMFFCKVLILVEGLEDVAHITSYISLLKLMTQYRRLGCHIVPTGGKSEIIKPLAMARQLKVPVYVVMDADTDAEREHHINMHKKDNASILSLMGHVDIDEWPDKHAWKADLTMWEHNLTKTVEEEIGDNWKAHVDAAAAYYGQPGGLDKNPLAVSRALEGAWNNDEKSESLKKLAMNIITFAEKALES
ncbi:ATP-dependent endonuclease [Solemya velesiana gill symbiont]|uniref:ATP-dependent endonuclease n=2 Tax=Solemya velesiana gill symbiont TaxID=1918948 RepID=A0A1T2KMP6_9GAMM|nr:ATP-dependent endonuclease [Solemya velesiana gill symbiont]